MGGWMGESMGGLMSNHQNQINLNLIEVSTIMDILDIWTFHLNHLSPLWGYFFFLCFNILFYSISFFLLLTIAKFSSVVTQQLLKTF